MNVSRHDVIVVGGGMVGAALAGLLGQDGLRVALVEPRAPDLAWPPAGYDIRTSAITRASQRLFERIGAWPGMTRRRVCPYREMRVWDTTGAGQIHFDCAQIGEPDLGHIVENAVIQAALWERLLELPPVDLCCPARAAALEVTTGEAALTLDSGAILRAPLLVGADGGQSWVRQQAGLASHGWSYHQEAVVAVVRSELPHRGTAWQRFAPDGPLAFLPLADHTCAIVWSTTPERARELLALDEADFLAALHESFGDALGRLLATGPRAAFPLRLAHAPRYTTARIALAGDAAHTIHPLAGQGVNLGLADAAALAATVSAARAAGHDPGHPLVLRRYERTRKADNLLMMGVMDGFQRLFGSDQPPLRQARNLGLDLAERLPALKKLIMRQALGL